MDFRRASRCLRIACFSLSRRSLSSCSLSRSYSPYVRVALPSWRSENGSKLSNGVSSCFDPVTGAGAGVEKSIRSPICAFAAPTLFLGLRLAGVFRDSSKEGMRRGGERGTVGLRIDFRGNTAADCAQSYGMSVTHLRNDIESDSLTFRLFPVAALSASSPPGPRLLLRSFFSLAELVWDSRLRLLESPIPVVKFSLSVPPLRLVCEIGASDCR